MVPVFLRSSGCKYKTISNNNKKEYNKTWLECFLKLLIFFLSGEFAYLHLTHFPRGPFVKQGPETNLLSFFATACLVDVVIEVVPTLL